MVPQVKEQPLARRYSIGLLCFVVRRSSTNQVTSKTTTTTTGTDAGKEIVSYSIRSTIFSIEAKLV
jgi:hypothetical protein